MTTLSGLVRHQSGRTGLVIVVLLIAAAALAPVVGTDPTRANFAVRIQPPSWDHPLGTDQLGRDILNRVVWGARVSISNVVTAILLGSTIGILLGSVSSYIGGNLDRALMRVVDVLLAFPILLLAIITVAILGPGQTQTAIAIGVALIAPFARLTRGQVLSVKQWEYVEASRAIGASGGRILARHILPNIFAPLLVFATLQSGAILLAEAGLSFLGLGPSPPTPSWGLMVNEGLGFVRIAWWMSILPGVAIFVVVLGVNLLGDALRDVLDPHIRMR